MSEQEFHGWMIIGSICFPIALLMWWIRERDERKFWERERFLNSPLVVYTAHFDGTTREVAAKKIQDVRQRLGIAA